MNKGRRSDKYIGMFKTGKELFWRHGIKRVTIEEICSEANVSKMTFYKFFSNKIEFAKIILEETLNQSIKKFDNLIHSNLPFTEKIEQMFVLKLEVTEDISAEFIADIYKNSFKELQQIVEKQRQTSLKLFTDFLIDSQKKGLIRKDIKIEFILCYADKMSEMLNDKKLVSRYDTMQDLIMEGMKFLFYGLSIQK